MKWPIGMGGGRVRPPELNSRLGPDNYAPLAVAKLHAGKGPLLDFHQEAAKSVGASQGRRGVPGDKTTEHMSTAQPNVDLSAKPGGAPNRVPRFLSQGFRPFFLFAGVYSVLAMAAWIAWLALHDANAVVTRPSFAVAPHLWHGHEMLFGYGGAVITGFLLTALPNWTGTPPVSGRPLALLAGTWLLGRFAVWFSAALPAMVVAMVDLSHLLLLSCFVAHAFSKKPAPRNLIFIVLLLMLAFANGAVHAEWLGWSEGTASWGLSLAVFLFSGLIVILGGRVVPAFTRNALLKSGRSDSLPRSFNPLDMASILLAVALVVAHLLSAPPFVVMLIAAAAALASAARLSLWRGLACLDQPIVWSLHLGYLMVVLGFAAVALSWTGIIGPVAAQHVLAAGAVGCMTLAIMTRASLGHTGRPLRVGRSTALAYLLVAMSAVIRALAPSAFSDAYFPIMYLSGGLWMAGFALFCISYMPVLLGPSQAHGAGE